MLLKCATLAVLCFCQTMAGGTSTIPDDRRTGAIGGRLVVAQRAEPKTLNPFNALDVGSREVISLINGSLINIDQVSLAPVAGLARSWTSTHDGRHYTLHLRSGVRFSDGQPFTADDVLFTFRVHEDEKTRSPQRELLIVGGKPLSVVKLDPLTVRFDLAAPYPVAVKLFAGIGILPEHLLAESYRKGTLTSQWNLSTAPARVAGLGPFVVKEYVPGERLVLHRNRLYWKVDSQSVHLPYLDEIVFEFCSNEDQQILRLLSGDADLVEELSADNFAVMRAERKRAGIDLRDLGPGLEYTFLLLNQNPPPPESASSLQRRQCWFRTEAFRQAVSAAIDRDAIVRLACRGAATPLWAQVTDGNRAWVNALVPHPPHSLERSRELLRTAGFSWDSANRLVSPEKEVVNFSILTSAGNAQREKIATLIQADLKEIGIETPILTLEFRALVDRVFNTHTYEAAVMTLYSGDTDPNSELNVWSVNGSTHLWNLSGKAVEPWEQDIDRYMRQQLITLSFAERKRLYDRVQYLVATKMPIICLVSPHVLLGASRRIHNLRPSILRPYALWNADELYLDPRGAQP